MPHPDDPNAAPLSTTEEEQVRRWLERERARAVRASDRAATDERELLRRRGERDPCAYLSPAAAQEDADLAGQRDRARASVQHMEEIEAAIRRLESDPGRFRTCSACAEPISLERLELIPYTRACGACAGRSEA